MLGLKVVQFYKTIQFYIECEKSGDFNQLQLEQIYYGLENKLTIEQVKMYADKKYNNFQMSQIYLGLKNGLTMEQVELFANENLHYLQMSEIRLGLENGLSIEEISFYMNKRFDWLQGAEIRLGFEHGLTINQIKIYADERYDRWQMKAIREKLENNSNPEEIKMLMSGNHYKLAAPAFQAPLTPLDEIMQKLDLLSIAELRIVSSEINKKVNCLKVVPLENLEKPKQFKKLR